LMDSGRIVVVRKTADEIVNNSAALQDDDDLLFPMAINEVYEFTAILLCLSNAIPDIKFAFTMPAGGDVDWVFTGVDAVGAMVSVSVNGSGVSTHMTAIAAPQVIVLHGIARNAGAAGNCQLQWAQNVANASDTIVYTNSNLIAHRLL